MRIYQPLEITGAGGTPTGRWRLCSFSDEVDNVHPLCTCEGGHASAEEASACPAARERADRDLPKGVSREDLGRRAFNAYCRRAGRQILRGGVIPQWTELESWEREVWCVAAEAVRGAL